MMARRSRTHLAANDNGKAPGARRSSSNVRVENILIMSALERDNILGFFSTLECWMQAANDNEPSPAPSSSSDEVPDER